MVSGVFFKGGKVYGGPKEGDTDTFLTQTFDNVVLSDFVHTGLILDTTSPVSGVASAKLIHQSGISQSFKEVRTVSERYRGLPMVVSITGKSGASLGNVTVLFRDETNSLDIQSSQQVSLTGSIRTLQFGVQIPSNCQSFSYTITALPESGAPETYIDDVTIKNYWVGSSVQGQTEYRIEVPAVSDTVDMGPITIAGSTTSPVKGVVVHDKLTYTRRGNRALIQFQYQQSSGGTNGSGNIQIILPAGLTVDTTRINASISEVGTVVGTGRLSTNGIGRLVDFSLSGSNTILLAGSEAGSNFIANYATFVMNSFFSMSGQIDIPILGWEDTVQQSFTSTDIVPSKAMVGNASIDVPIATEWINAGPIVVTGTTSNPTKGNVLLDKFWWRRNGDTMEARVEYQQNSAGTDGSGDYLLALPTGYEVDISKLTPDNVAEGVGAFQVNGNLGTAALQSNISIGLGSVSAYDSTRVRTSLIYSDQANNNNTGAWCSAFYAFGANANLTVSLEFRVPIKGWAVTEAKVWSATQSVVIEEIDVDLTIRGALGFGSTNTLVVRYNNANVVSIGNGVTYNSSATLGDSFTITSDGVYNINTTISGNTGAFGVGITKNATNLALDGNSQTALIASSYLPDQTSNVDMPVNWAGKLRAGDVIHIIRTFGTVVLSASATRSYITIAKQGSLKQVQTIADQKIDIPISELRFENASARGTDVEVNTILFTSLTKIVGDAFLVDSSNGTKITVLKDGIVSVSGFVYFSSNGYVYVTKNQAASVATTPEFMTGAGNNASSASAPVCNISGSFKVSAGDVLRVYSPSNAPTANIGTSLTLTHQEQRVAVAVTNVLPQFSESDTSIIVAGANGVGSVNNKIKRFSNILQNKGSSVTYVDSSTSGGSFTVNENGVYHISYMDSSGTAQHFAISKNAIGTTESNSLPSENVLADSFQSDLDSLTRANSVAWSGYLNAGDIIRAHIQGSYSAPENPTLVKFTIAKLGKPNVTGVDVTAFINVPQVKREYFNKASANFGSTNTNIITFNNALVYKNSLGSNGIISYINSSTLGDSWTALKKCRVSVSFGAQTVTLSNAGYELRLLKNDITGVSSATLDFAGGNVQTGGGPEVEAARLSGTYELEAGDVLRIYCNSGTGLWNAAGSAWMSLEAEAASDQILTTPETFSTDTAGLVYSSSYTLATLPTAPVGTFISYIYTTGTNTRTQTATAPTQTVDSMRSNGIQLFTRIYNVTSTAASPCIIAIQIGKGMKGISLNLYKGAGKDIAGSIDYNRTTAYNIGFTFKEYNEITGVLLLDCGWSVDGDEIIRIFQYTDGTTATNGYVVINASKNPALVGISTNTVAVRAVQSSGQVVTNTGVGFDMVWDANETFDTHSAFNPATGVFRAPRPAKYKVHAKIRANGTAWTVGTELGLLIYKNGVTQSVSATVAHANNTFEMHATITDIVSMATGDELKIQVETNRTGGTITISSNSVLNFLTIESI